MVQAVSSFEEGCRKGLGIVVECQCGKRVTFRCMDFMGYIEPGADIEALAWRCQWCRAIAKYVRYAVIAKMERQDLCQWMPPAGMKRRWPI